MVAGSDEYLDRYYSPGGALKLGHRLQWIAENLTLPGYERPTFDRFMRHLPLRDVDRFVTGQRIGFFQETLNHPSYDGYWRARSTYERLAEVSVPAFIVGGWYDNYVESDLAAFSQLSKRSAAHRDRHRTLAAQYVDPVRRAAVWSEYRRSDTAIPTELVRSLAARVAARAGVSACSCADLRHGRESLAG